MSELGDLVKAATGRDLVAAEWRTTSIPPIDISRFGADHWSTFAYVETRIVDHKGTLNHQHMRCHARRHPVMMHAKGSGLGAADGSNYPTRLRAGEEAADHDDYDCVDDLIAAGLLTAHMPRVARRAGREADFFENAYGRPVSNGSGQIIHPDFVTGMDELELCVHATFSLTERGRQIASDLRAHKAAGRNFASFVAE